MRNRRASRGGLALVACLLSPAQLLAQPPDQATVVFAVSARGGWDLRTNAGGGLFTEAVLLALRQVDPAWCHLQKSDAQNQWDGHAVDSVLYRSLGWSVDIIRDSESLTATPAWQPDSVARYTAASCLDRPAPPLSPIPPRPDAVSSLLERLDRLQDQYGLSQHTLAAVQAALTHVASQLTVIEEHLDSQDAHHRRHDEAVDRPWWIDVLRAITPW